MAEATRAKALRRTHQPTNPNWNCFGAPKPEMQKLLSNLGPQAKKDRLVWLQHWAWRKMPAGPYPLFVYGFGWMKAYLHMEDYHAVYVYIPREDLNLDVEVLKIRWARDVMSIECRQQFKNENELLPVRSPCSGNVRHPKQEI